MEEWRVLYPNGASTEGVAYMIPEVIPESRLS
jgi:hypothetical protein